MYYICLAVVQLDAVTYDNQVSNPDLLSCNLRALRTAGVDGVMLDVWWGIVEKEGPKQYNWFGVPRAPEHGGGRGAQAAGGSHLPAQQCLQCGNHLYPLVVTVIHWCSLVLTLAAGWCRR